jgi:hypothetical protein
LAGLYRYFQAAPSLLVATFRAFGAALNEPAEIRIAMGTTHPAYSLSPNVSRFQSQMKVLAEDTLDLLEFALGERLG